MSNVTVQKMLGVHREMLGDQRDFNSFSLDTYVDIVFVIDGTGSMARTIQKVKDTTLSLQRDIVKGLNENHRKIQALRVKVIVFRDYYVDGANAMIESEFFHLPEENKRFYDFVNRIPAEGGGDEPENGLEALALAMNSDFVQDGERRRHIIVLFTDASAHPLEKRQTSTPHESYPTQMYRNLQELYEAWGGKQGMLGSGQSAGTRMADNDKRLIIFAPDVYPWNDISVELNHTIRKDMIAGHGGADLDMSDVLGNIIYSAVR